MNRLNFNYFIFFLISLTSQVVVASEMQAFKYGIRAPLFSEVTIDLVPLHLATDTTDQEADIGDLVNQLRGLSLHANVPQITVIISSLIARLEETRGSVDLDDNVRFLFTVALQEITNFAGRAGTLLLANFLLQNAANPTAAADVITQGLRAAIDSASEVAGFDIGLFVALVLRLKAFGADAEF